MPRIKLIHIICGGEVKWFEPPKPWVEPYYQCQRCGRPVVDYMMKKKQISRKNGQVIKNKR